MSGPGYLHPFLPGVIYANGAGEEIRTLAELKMNYFSYWIRSQPDWWLTFKGEGTTVGWRATARRENYLQDALTLLGPADDIENAMDPRGPRYALHVLMAAPVLTEDQVDWVLDELSDFATRRVPRDDVQPSCFDRIWEGHQLPTELVSSISMDLDRLYNEGPPVLQDASGRFPLVHPHSHPLIHGRTLVREHKPLDEEGSCITFTRAKPPDPRKTFHNLHSTFLPTTFRVPSRAADSLFAESYINGIPPFPSHHILRDNIVELLHRTVPLFENVLTDLHRHNTAFIRPRIRDGYKHTNAHEAPPEKPGQAPGDTTDDEQDEDAWFDYRWRLSCWEASRKVILPDLPKGGYICNERRRRTKISLRGETIQVVLEVLRDTVSPSQSPVQKPWGVVGMKNDSIVASIVVVLESRNVKGGPISFRTAVTQPRHASDDKAAQQTWGMSSFSPKCQIQGLVPLERGRPVAWPNIYQHCILPPSLVDSTAPGYRTLLFFHLVDPETPILSTTFVPPQQEAWMRRALLESLDQRLPVEIVEKILREAVEMRCILDEAESKAICADLTLKGEGFASWMNQMYFEIPFI